MCQHCSPRNMKEWVSSTLQSNQRPVIPIMTHPGIEYTGKRVLDAVTDGVAHFQSVQALNQAFPQAGALTTIMDLTVEAEAFGASIHFAPDEIPTVVGALLSSPEEIASLALPPLTAGRIPQYLLANRLIAASTKDKPIFAGCIGPFSLAGRLYEMTEFMMLCYTDEEIAKSLLGKCTAFLIDYCKAIKETGANGVIIAEPAAGLLSNDGCEEFSSRYVKEMVEAVQDDSFLVILHNCGNTGHCTPAMLTTGAAGYHFGNKASMEEALSACPEEVLVMGNIDPVGILKEGTVEEVTQAVSKLLNRCKQHRNFILSTGCDVPPHIASENITAFYQAGLAQ